MSMAYENANKMFRSTDCGETHYGISSRKRNSVKYQKDADNTEQILEELRLSQHMQSFRENDITKEADILQLSVQDINDLGITKIGERNRLREWIQTHTDVQAYPVTPLETIIPGFTLDQIDNYKAVFNVLDQNKSGYITRLQLSRAIESLGQHQNESQLKDAFIQTHLSDCINVDDFIELLRHSKENSDSYPGLNLITDLPGYVLSNLKEKDSVNVDTSPTPRYDYNSREDHTQPRYIKPLGAVRANTTLSHVSASKNRGDNAFRCGDYAQAVVEYSQALSFDPSNWTLLSNRSIAHLKQGNAVCAYQDARDCIASNPNFSKGYTRLAAAQEALKRFEDAMTSYTKVLNMEPSNNIAQVGLQRCADECRSRYSSIFDLVDENRDGVVDFDEFTSALQRLSIDISSSEAIQIFREADKNCSGSLDFDEFSDTMRRAASGDRRLAAIHGISKQLQHTVEELRRAPKNPQVNYSYILNADITPEAIQMVETCTSGTYKLAPPVDTCRDQYCTRAYNFLVVDENIIKIMAQTYCEEFVSNLKSDLQKKGVSIDVDTMVDMQAVTMDSIRTFETIVHCYSHMNGLSSPPSESVSMQLHSFRKAAMLWASNESVDDIRSPLLQIGIPDEQQFSNHQQLQATNGTDSDDSDNEGGRDNRQLWIGAAKLTFKVLAMLV
mmetsp:Transcript_17478/g.27002  ORF Transcript_17478/g.27002 Transcript_17478/m.27002 type:complete len:671 (+) Transcript_17478:88-2100(+)|eukprot:CAMPEP_0195307670 /NCGR_PEP_ID=MMETSP0707-20130614/37833_1 /TAXON_ID=33640 /ORGANISM="Asterionellopsis glacialis, Strain CCMP134" /LENGTH=670 /DNA_ID=CAMNT_0040371923 /DNA_START=60 /DNA_END=2072 /DNA_ORIENTATION=+